IFDGSAFYDLNGDDKDERDAWAEITKDRWGQSPWRHLFSGLAWLVVFCLAAILLARLGW
uniref:hypothetical protein n=1 Tax=Salmonella sp. SAL04269 TaxID=3159847 RepID=UPI00397E4FCE